MKDYQLSCDTVMALGTAMAIAGLWTHQFWILFGGVLIFIMGVGAIPERERADYQEPDYNTFEGFSYPLESDSNQWEGFSYPLEGDSNPLEWQSNPLEWDSNGV